MRNRNALVAALLPLIVAVVGCGDPYATPARSTATNAGGDPHQPPQERLGERPPEDRRIDPAVGATTPEAAVRRYAELSINWTATTIEARQRELARRSVGGARQTALRAAARVADDETLRRSGVSNSGTVIATTAGSGSATGSWVVVTREETRGRSSYSGLPPTHHITLAKVEKRPAGWIVSSWQPVS